MIGSSGMSVPDYNYLSLRWFFYGAGDAYNPDIEYISNSSSST